MPRRALLLLKLSVKKGESYIADCSTTFPRLSRVGEVRNREDAANVRTLLALRFAANRAEHGWRAFLTCSHC